MTDDQFNAIAERLRDLGDAIAHAGAQVTAKAEGAAQRLPQLERDLGDAVLAEALGTGDADATARIRRERAAVRNAIEDGKLITEAVERAELRRGQHGRTAKRAHDAGEPVKLNLPAYLNLEVTQS